MINYEEKMHPLQIQIQKKGNNLDKLLFNENVTFIRTKKSFL